MSGVEIISVLSVIKEMETKSVRSEAKAPLIIYVFSSFFEDLFFFSNQEFTAVDPNDPISEPIDLAACEKISE